MIEKENRVTVAGLVRRFGVSSVTVRADLDTLAKNGALVRSHGGAVKQLNPARDYPVSIKEALHHAEKVRIAQAAAALLKPSQTVILDSGTTTLEIARQLKLLKLKSLTVVTNALNVAAQLVDVPGLSLIMVGGILRQVSGSFVGPQAERMLSDLHADVCFLGVDGLDPDAGPTTPDILEAQLNGTMIRVSSEVTIVADASKIGRRSLSAIGSLTAIRRLITDNRIDPAMVRAFESKGLDVIVV